MILLQKGEGFEHELVSDLIKMQLSITNKTIIITSHMYHFYNRYSIFKSN